MAGHRKSYRKANHDYSSPGFYFITILVKDRYPVFGKLFLDRVELSDYGEIASACLQSLEKSFSFIKLDEFIIMPDHIHAIIQILEPHSRMRHHSPDIDYNVERHRRRKDLINQVLTTTMASDQTTGDIPTASTPDKSWILMTKPEMHLGKIIRHYKAKTSFLIHKEGLKNFGWVSRYFDHIIRTEKSLYFIRKYIKNNPIRHHYEKAA